MVTCADLDRCAADAIARGHPLIDAALTRVSNRPS